MARRRRDNDDNDDDYDHDDARDGDPPFPGVVRAAGVIWIVLSAFLLFSSCLSYFVFPVLLRVGNGDDRPDKFAPSGGEVCGFWLGIGIAVAFLVFGIQTVRGAARDTIAGGILSLVVGLLYVVAGGMVLLLNEQLGQGVIVVGLLTVTLGLVCLLPGVLGLVGRTRYREWRLENDPRRRRRREWEDEDDRDRPKRRRVAQPVVPMMAVDCPRCFNTVRVPVASAGLTYPCPKCQNPIDVPSDTDASGEQ